MKKFLVLLSLLFCGLTHAATETLKWYVDGETYATTTCESGGDVILPVTTPTKAGYVFAGWSFGTYDLSTLDASINGNRCYARNSTNTCYFRDSSMQSSQQQACTLSDYSDLALREWKVLFSYGIIRGESACSGSYGTTIAENGNPDLSNPNQGGIYCWCHVTGFIPSGESVVRKPAVSLWAFSYTDNSASECASRCANSCGAGTQSTSLRRAGLYGL